LENCKRMHALVIRVFFYIWRNEIKCDINVSSFYKIKAPVKYLTWLNWAYKSFENVYLFAINWLRLIRACSRDKAEKPSEDRRKRRRVDSSEGTEKRRYGSLSCRRKSCTMLHRSNAKSRCGETRRGGICANYI